MANAVKKLCFFLGSPPLGRKPSKAALLLGRVVSERRKYIYKGDRRKKNKKRLTPKILWEK